MWAIESFAERLRIIDTNDFVGTPAVTHAIGVDLTKIIPLAIPNRAHLAVVHAVLVSCDLEAKAAVIKDA